MSGLRKADWPRGRAGDSKQSQEMLWRVLLSCLQSSLLSRLWRRVQNHIHEHTRSHHWHTLLIEHVLWRDGKLPFSSYGRPTANCESYCQPYSSIDFWCEAFLTTGRDLETGPIYSWQQQLCSFYPQKPDPRLPLRTPAGQLGRSCVRAGLWAFLAASWSWGTTTTSVGQANGKTKRRSMAYLLLLLPATSPSPGCDQRQHKQGFQPQPNLAEYLLATGTLWTPDSRVAGVWRP